MNRAWELAQQKDRQPTPAPALRKPEAARQDTASEVIAVVNGRTILRQQVVDLLLCAHGPGVLEQLIVLEAAEHEAAKRGVTVSDADLEAEYERALKQLGPSLPSAGPAVFDRKAGEAMLGEILSRRNISEEEYRLAIRRNAYLRKIAEQDLEFTEPQLRDEFARTYGTRVQVRHIQVADVRAAQRCRDELDAGADFVDLVTRHSANPNTVQTEGLLRPFSEEDPDVPALLREVAFALTDGQVSNPVRVGDWYHLIRRERTFPPSRVYYRDVRDELEKRLQARAIEPAIHELYRALYDRADITIRDPVLQAAVAERREPAAGGASPSGLAERE